MFLIISVRVMNVGVEYPLEYIKCDKCNKNHVKPILSLENIKDEPFMFPSVDNTNVYTITLPQTKKVINIKKLNGHDRKKINDELSKNKDEENYFKHLVLLTRSMSMIDSDVVGNNLGEKFNFLLSLPFKDSQFLSKEIIRIFGVIDPIIEFTCERKRCNNVIEVPVEVSENFFFPEI